MSFLRGSHNYVWCTTSVLGKGATGSVFQVSNASLHCIKLCKHINNYCVCMYKCI